MARPKDPAVRARLLDKAARMLRAREPVTLRSLVDGTGVSTMAVYTHFGGMDGMWRALRQEGFSLLAVGFAAVPVTDDPVQDLAAYARAYVRNALDHPDLYRVMFEADFLLEDAQAADATLEHMVQAANRGKEAGRFAPDIDPLGLATQTWAVTHGLVSLVATGPLPDDALAHAVPLLAALFTGAGDRRERCQQSVEKAWPPGIVRAGQPRLPSAHQP